MLFNESFCRTPLLIILDLFDPMLLTHQKLHFSSFLSALNYVSEKLYCTLMSEQKAMLILNVSS